MLHVLAMLALTAVQTPEEAIDGAEIGDAAHFVAFESHGKYHAEKTDKQKGNTVIKGSWVMKDDTVEARPSSCKGPACKELNKGYKAKVAVVAERALLIRTDPPGMMLETGSYYCHYQGCEKRVGVEVLGKSAKTSAINYVVDALIDHNKGRNSTVVWAGERASDDVKKSRLEFCNREPDRAKAGAAEVQKDLAELGWLGKLDIAESKSADCLWDVRVLLADDAAPPQKQR